MVEKGIRGEVSIISNRYGKANNKYMGKSFKDIEPSKYITYLDANNLYGWATGKPLPTHGFKWMTVSELETWEKHSCILEVDLKYPKSLHDLHSDYPLAPEQIEVNKVDKLILAIILLIIYQVYLPDFIRRCLVCLKMKLGVKL